MSHVNKVLTLVACGCLCLMVTTSASADFLGIKAVNKDDVDTNTLCTLAGGDFVPVGLTVCNVSAIFDDPANRMLSVGDADLQVFDGGAPSTFFQHPGDFGGFTSYGCAVPTTPPPFGFPDIICDSYITIGVKCNQDGTDGTATDGAWVGSEFQTNGHIVGGWFNGSPPNGQGDAGTYPDLQVLFLQSSVEIGQSMSGTITVFWQAVPGGEVVGSPVEVECAAKCTEGIPCTDDDPCTENDECIAGVCSGTPIDCSGQDDACNNGVCNPNTGMCEAVAKDDGTACDDGNPCTAGDTCSGGECVGAGCTGDDDCSDGNACTTDSCDPASGCCTNTPDCTSDADCNDGLACTDDSCDVASGCCSNTPVSCSEDNDPCTVAACVEPGGCTQVPGNDGGACDDGDLCTENDSCSGGDCAGSDIVCDEPGQSCNPNNGLCEFCQTDDQCDDGQACNGSETCDPAAGCQPGTPVDCSGLDDDCNVGVCVDPDGSCDTEPANEGGACDDGSLCTEGDTCSGGDCSGDPVDCGEDLVCDPNTGECVEVSDFLDIIPGKCPNLLRRNGLGFVKISLLGTDDLDANDVDVDTLSLSRVDPPGCAGAVAPRMNPRPHVRDRATPFLGELCDCHSRRKDGVDDLDMKFKLAEIVNELCLDSMPAGTEVRLELTGSTYGGQPIRAADCVILGRDLGPNP